MYCLRTTESKEDIYIWNASSQQMRLIYITMTQTRCVLSVESKKTHMFDDMTLDVPDAHFIKNYISSTYK
jgi:hypothetical protein